MNFTRVLTTANAACPSRITRRFIGSCKRHWLHARYYSDQPPDVARFVKNMDYVPSLTRPDSDARPIINPNSIFSEDSAWDRVFSNLDDYKARTSPSRRDLSPRHRKQPQRPSQPGRRQTMTAGELRAFDDIFNMIFDAASNQERTQRAEPSQKNTIGDMFSSLRASSRGLRWTTEQEELMDRKKEEIDLCASDVELLHWTQREVLDTFDNLQRVPQSSAVEKGAESPSDIPLSTKPSALQIQTYSQLVAHLMRTFRDKYRDPHLALALFDKVRRRSLVSYVFGCSTQVYNELIETKWVWFRDLRGVHDAVEEMVVNGVGFDNRTRRLVEMVRHGVRERNAWVENVDVHSQEVWNLLVRLDHSIVKSSSRRKKTPKWEEWKRESLSDEGGERWGFGKWSGTQ
ncbi:hypothetical protein AX14_000787 [Amanita brunnescens Koide BX004]|nr:hypothetical protein AX14_000787 [Amanita brunnescens Koide BX004]